MTGLSAYTCTPRQIRKHVIRCMLAGLVPFIQSSPAMGKSAIVASIAEEYNLQLIDHRLSTSAPEDLTGLPQFKDGTASFAPFDTFPIEGTPLPGQHWEMIDGKAQLVGEPTKQGWLLFLDEFNSAPKAIQAAAYKLVLDKAVGLHKLHQRVVIVCAGNLSTDRAIVNPIGTAMQSRLVNLTMELKKDKYGQHSEFLEDVAIKRKWDPRIIAFLSYKPSLLHDFRPDHNDKTFCSPRTWEFMNKLITGQELKQEDAALYAGTITSGIALDFMSFTQIYEKMPRIELIVNNPEGYDLPTDQATRWATITHLVERVIDDNVNPVITYVNRFPADFRVLFLRFLVQQKPEMKKHHAYRQMMVDLSKYLHDDIEEAEAA